MKRNLTIFSIFAVIFLSAASSALAFNGERKGFILGLGAGTGFTSISDFDTYFGIQTDFKIGYAPSNSFALYYNSKVAWYGLDDNEGGSIIIADGLSSIAGTYFFNPEGPTGLISGGVGLATWDAIFEESSTGSNGFGFFVGGGYQFSKNWDVAAHLKWGNPGEADFNFKTITYSVTISVLWH